MLPLLYASRLKRFPLGLSSKPPRFTDSDVNVICVLSFEAFLLGVLQLGPASSDTSCALPCLDATWKALGFLDLSKPVVLFLIALGCYLLVSEGVRVSFLKATYVLLA